MIKDAGAVSAGQPDADPLPGNSVWFVPQDRLNGPDNSLGGNHIPAAVKACGGRVWAGVAVQVRAEAMGLEAIGPGLRRPGITPVEAQRRRAQSGCQVYRP